MKVCRITLEANGNLQVESKKKNTLWTEVWESDSSIEDYGEDHFFFQLSKGDLAIYRDGKSFDSPELHWVPAETEKGLKYLYITDSCFFSLEKAKGVVYWTNAPQHID